MHGEINLYRSFYWSLLILYIHKADTLNICMKKFDAKCFEVSHSFNTLLALLLCDFFSLSSLWLIWVSLLLWDFLSLSLWLFESLISVSFWVSLHCYFRVSLFCDVEVSRPRYDFLAHLSQRLTRWAYSIAMVRRPSVVVRRRPHFQTCISL